MSASSLTHESFLSKAAAKGYTPDSLPALRQYAHHHESGNLEAAKRIEENLRDFLEQHPERT
jgi:hypothetical protein